MQIVFLNQECCGKMSREISKEKGSGAPGITGAGKALLKTSPFLTDDSLKLRQTPPVRFKTNF